MILRFQAAAIGAAIVLTASGGAASAASVVDVDNLLIVSPYQGASGPAAVSYVRMGGRREDALYQTWTVGAAGRLDRIDIVGMAAGQRALTEGAHYDDLNFTLTLGVYRGGVDVPGTFELGKVSMSASDLGFGPSLASFDFSSYDIKAVEGEVLTFKMFVESCPDMFECVNSWGSLNDVNGVGTTNGYLGGGAFVEFGRRYYPIGDGQDLNFRTWMSAVPEPSAWAMMIIGFSGVGSMVRTSRRRLTA
jgi:hypothetical protein